MFKKRNILLTCVSLVVLIGVLSLAAHFISRNKVNPLFHKEWTATVFTSSDGKIQKNPSETLIFKPHLALIQIGMSLYKEPVLRYSIINNLRQGTIPYSTVFVYPKTGSKIALYVFNHGTKLLTIRKEGQLTIQQRYMATPLK